MCCWRRWWWPSACMRLVFVRSVVQLGGCTHASVICIWQLVCVVFIRQLRLCLGLKLVEHIHEQPAFQTASHSCADAHAWRPTMTMELVDNAAGTALHNYSHRHSCFACCMQMPTGTGKTITLLSLITSYQLAHPEVRRAQGWRPRQFTTSSSNKHLGALWPRRHFGKAARIVSNGGGKGRVSR